MKKAPLRRILYPSEVEERMTGSGDSGSPAPSSWQGPPGSAQPTPANGARLERKVRINNPQGLHMRPSAAFATAAMRFQSAVTVSLDGRSVNGKSAIDMMMLVAMPGSEVTLEVEGPDAPDALEALAGLLAAPGSDFPQ
jgi:phosphotransferase system HPr (HPr) family protein